MGDVDTMVFSPDGTRLAVVGVDGTLRLWHLSTGALRAGHDQPLRAVAFAPDGRTLAVVAIEDDGDRVTLLDTTTGRAQRTIEPGARSPLSLAFSPDGRTLATVSTGNGAVETWDTRTGSLQDKFTAGGAVSAAAFGSDGRTLALSGERGVHLWDLATDRRRLTVPARAAAAVAFSPDGRTLATATDGSVALWNVDLPDPARAIRTVCDAVATASTPQERSRHLPDRSADSGCGYSLNRTVRNGRRQSRRAARHYDPWAWTGSSAS
ncbi:WD40 repeat domain-containing protein [Streptomyces nigra]